MMTKEKFMSMAIDEAREGIEASRGGPFGAVIEKDGEVIAASHNTVLEEKDPTHHAEVKAISLASKKLGTHDLSGCTIYSTTEPCPMCFSAIHWARITRLVYGTSISDVKKLGFNELAIEVSKMKEMGSSSLEIEKDFMREKCEELLEYWDSLPNKEVY